MLRRLVVPKVRRLAVMVLLLAPPVVLAAPTAVSAGGGCHQAYEGGQTEGTGTAVALKMNCFAPTVLRVDSGAEVTFTNADAIAHVVLGTGWGSAELLEAGASMRQRFDSVGTFPYSCNLHPGMNGAVIVGDGKGPGRVTEMAPATQLAAAAAPADGDGPGDDGDGLPVWPTVAVGIAVAFFGFAAGQVVARRARTTAAD